MIRYKNYSLEPESGRFNLYKEITIKADPKKNIPEHPSTIVMGYSMQFGYALHLIVTDILEQDEEDATIPQYINAYKSEKESLLNAIND